MSDHFNAYGPYAPQGYGYDQQGQPGQASQQTNQQANQQPGQQPGYGSAQPGQYFDPRYAGQYGYAQPYAPAYGAQPKAAPASGLASWYNVRHPDYLKGLLLGAGAALVLTNPTVQKALVGGAVRVWAAVQGGIEEIKEQIEDVKAELSREG